jgi:2-amino-4-hydroxy-6-hydroxymethyldihydropteridine diphosphokinase
VTTPPSRFASRASPEPVDVFLGLGSNMGNRADNLARATDLLSQRVKMVRTSSTYDTEPVGGTRQPRFLNTVCHVRTRLSPLGLLTLCKGIESKLGRKPGKPNAPRPMDIDILFYGDRVVETAKVTIPHPRLTERAFVLVPLAEIAPELAHPVTGQTATRMLAALQKGIQGVLKWDGDQG